MDELRIAISTWSVFRWFQMKRLDGVSFPKFCVDRFGIDRFEYVEDDMYPDSSSGESVDAYLDRIQEAVEAVNGEIVCMALRNDFTDMGKAQADVTRIQEWIRQAGRLGVPLVRVYLGRHFNGQIPDRVFKCIEQLRPHAEQEGVRLAIENRGGRYERHEDIVSVLEHFNSRWLGACFDAGNVYQGKQQDYIKALIPRAVHIHAKNYPKNEGEGMVFPKMDYVPCMQALRERAVEYNGYWAVEYEELTTDLNAQVEGVHRTLTLLQDAFVAVFPSSDAC